MTTQASNDAQSDGSAPHQQDLPTQRSHTRTGLITISEDHLWQERLGTDLRSLGISDPVPLRVRVALRRRAHLSALSRLAVYAIYSVLLPLALFVVSGLIFWAAALPFGYQDDHNPLLHHDLFFGGLWLFPGMTGGGQIQLPPAVENALVVVAVFAFFWAVLWGAVRFLAQHGKPSLVSWFFLARRYALVMQCAAVVHACAAARRAGGERQASMLRKVSKELRVVLRNLSDAPTSRRSVPRFSPRKRALRAHARHVGAALRALELRIDSEPEVALRELACALVQVSDRYCHSRLGVLLDEHYLADVEQPPNRELLRWVVALFIAGGSVAGLAISGVLPDSAQGPVYAIAITLSLTIAFGRKIQRSIEVLGAITGGV